MFFLQQAKISLRVRKYIMAQFKEHALGKDTAYPRTYLDKSGKEVAVLKDPMSSAPTLVDPGPDGFPPSFWADYQAVQARLTQRRAAPNPYAGLRPTSTMGTQGYTIQPMNTAGQFVPVQQMSVEELRQQAPLTTAQFQEALLNLQRMGVPLTTSTPAVQPQAPRTTTTPTFIGGEWIDIVRNDATNEGNR